MKTLTIASSKGNYPLFCGSGLLNAAGRLLAENKILSEGCRIMIVTDSNVGPLYGNVVRGALSGYGFEADIFTVPAGEESKSIERLSDIYSALIRAGIKRTDAIIALGGGVVGDLAGFAAHTFMRGINLVQIPTSLLAQVDSSVGGKVAVNLPEGKNLVGGFCPPAAVITDTKTLETLNPRLMADGFAEVIKYGVIGDAELFDILERSGGINGTSGIMGDIIIRCCARKKEVVEQDETEKGNRMILNFGHTFGHIIEKAMDYGTFTHGEAVAIGMCRMARAGEIRGWTKEGTAERIRRVVRMYGLPDEPDNIQETKISNTLSKTLKVDKKGSRDGMTIVVAEETGICSLKFVSFSEVERLWMESRSIR